LTIPEADSLRALADQPMTLLVELERRVRAATAAPTAPVGASDEWIGVAVRIGGEAYLFARDEVREVLGLPAPLTRVPGASQWIMGIANVRGQVLPIVDLRRFLGAGVTPLTRNVRVVAVNHRDIPTGLVVDEVQGFRRFQEGGFDESLPSTTLASTPWLAGSFGLGAERVPVMSLRRLLEDPAFNGGAA
jgi:twitching motility protein PilI